MYDLVGDSSAEGVACKCCSNWDGWKVGMKGSYLGRFYCSVDVSLTAPCL